MQARHRSQGHFSPVRFASRMSARLARGLAYFSTPFETFRLPRSVEHEWLNSVLSERGALCFAHPDMHWQIRLLPEQCDAGRWEQPLMKDAMMDSQPTGRTLELVTVA